MNDRQIRQQEIESVIPRTTLARHVIERQRSLADDREKLPPVHRLIRTVIEEAGFPNPPLSLIQAVQREVARLKNGPRFDLFQ